MCTEAAKHNYFGVLKWLVLIKHKIRASTINSAAKHGNLDILKWALPNGNVRIDEDIYESAAKSGNLDLFKWLVEYDQLNPVQRCLDWLRNVKSSDYSRYVTAGVIKKAIRSGNLELVQYLLDMHNPMGLYSSILKIASQYNHKHIVQWVTTECLIFWDYSRCDGAILSGNVDMLKYVENLGFRMNYQSFANAVSKESIPMIEYVIGKIGVQDKEGVVHSGYVHVLKWLREHGYKCDNMLCLADAIILGQEQSIKWLIENGYDVPFNDVFISSIKRGHTHILETFKEKWPQNNCITDVMGYISFGGLMIKLDFKDAIEITNWIKINKCRHIHSHFTDILCNCRNSMDKHYANFDLYSN